MKKKRQRRKDALESQAGIPPIDPIELHKSFHFTQ
jgi:hypothetical protein